MKKLIWYSLLFCFGCTSRQEKSMVQVRLADNKRSVRFTGLNYAIISEINRDSASWQNLLPVYRMPADTDLKNYQPAQPGNYLLKDSAIVFTPDTPFTKGRTYFMRYYQFGEGTTAQDFIRGRKKLGSTHYVDLVFKGG